MPCEPKNRPNLFEILTYPIILLVTIAFLVTVVFGQAGQATRTAKSDPTGVACTSNSPLLTWNKADYICVNSAYRLATVKNVLGRDVRNDGTDTSSQLTAALAAASSGDVLYFPRGTYGLGTATFTWPSGVDAVFDGAIFSSTATTGTIFSISSNTTWAGNVTIKRASPSSTNEVTLVNISGATNVSLGNVSLENAHLGLVVQNSSYVTTGTIKGTNIDGQYSGGAAGGDLLNIIDVQNSSFGDVLGVEIAKAAVYFGVDGSLTQTQNVQVGNITATLTTGKCCGSALAIRNGKKISVGNVIAVGGYRGVVVQHETGDTAALEDIQVGNLTVRDQATASAFALSSARNGAATIKNLHVGNIVAGSGTGGAVQLLDVEGGSIGNIWAKTFSAGAETVLLTTINDFTVGDIYVEDVQFAGVYALTSNRINFGNIYVKNNSRSGSASYGVVFDTCTYTQALDVIAENTSGTGHSRPLQSIANTTNKVRSCSSIGTTTDGTCALNGTAFASVREYRLFRSAVPTAGTWTLGDTIWNTAPAALGVLGWVCTTAGTPGTWSPLYANNQATGTTSTPTFNATTITSTSANALAVGANGTTNPVVKVNAATASVATGIEITGAAAGGNVAVAAISSGSNESLQLSSKGTGIVLVGDTGTASATAGAATSNTQRGTITSEALTTAAGASYTLTLTNSKITTSSMIFVSFTNGTNTQGTLELGMVTPGSGSATIIIRNTHSADALNGTIKINFFVM